MTGEAEGEKGRERENGREGERVNGRMGSEYLCALVLVCLPIDTNMPANI
jgi:hypothetical protein